MMLFSRISRFFTRCALARQRPASYSSWTDHVQQQQQQLNLAQLRTDDPSGSAMENALLQPLCADPEQLVAAILTETLVLPHSDLALQRGHNVDCGGDGYWCWWLLSPFGHLETCLVDAGVGDGLSAVVQMDGVRVALSPEQKERLRQHLEERWRDSQTA